MDSCWQMTVTINYSIDSFKLSQFGNTCLKTKLCHTVSKVKPKVVDDSTSAFLDPCRIVTLYEKSQLWLSDEFVCPRKVIQRLSIALSICFSLSENLPHCNVMSRFSKLDEKPLIVSVCTKLILELFYIWSSICSVAFEVKRILSRSCRAKIRHFGTCTSLKRQRNYQG